MTRARTSPPPSLPGVRFRLIATDLDGTLLSPGEIISERSVAALGAAREAGVTVVFATGRSHYSVLPIVGGRRVVDWLVCSNGATLYDPMVDAVTDRLVIQDEAISTIFSAVLEVFPTAAFAWETGSGFLWDATWRAFDPSGGDYAGKPRVERTGPLPTDVTKVLIGVPGVASEELVGPVTELAPTTVHVSHSGAPFIEVTVDGAHKGAALGRLCSSLGIVASEVVAFGDNHNDLSMLSWAGHSVAMPHAGDAVRAMADEMAPPNGENGVAQVIERLLG